MSDENVESTPEKKIRSSLPNIGNHLRRIMRLNNTREVRSNEELQEMEATDSDESITIDINNTFQLDSLSIDDTYSNPSHNLSISDRPSNLFQLHSTDIPSTSTALEPTASNDLPVESNMTISTIYSPSTNPTSLMFSHDVNTIQDTTVTSVVNEEGAIIAGNPRDFAAALRIHVRNENDEEINIEPTRVPLYVTNENQNYIGSNQIDGNLSSG
ncbi:hypothetical protein PV326_008244, partial [Microctonus aethiopoides]